MARFVLLFLQKKGEISAIIDQIKKEHNHPACDQCTKQSTCTKECLMHMLMSVNDDYQEIKEQIKRLLPTMHFIFLIDSKEDEGYLYKGDGSLSDLKKGFIAQAVEAYEHITRQPDVFLRISDARMFTSVDPMLN